MWNFCQWKNSLKTKLIFTGCFHPQIGRQPGPRASLLLPSSLVLSQITAHLQITLHSQSFLFPVNIPRICFLSSGDCLIRFPTFFSSTSNFKATLKKITFYHFLIHFQFYPFFTLLFLKLNSHITSSYIIFFKNYLFICLFIYLWLCWVFVSVRGLSLVAASGGHSSSRCAGLSLLRPLLLRSTGSRRAGSVIVAHGLSRSGACGIFPDQGSNPCPLHWQADSQPLRHQGSPPILSLKKFLLEYS